MIHSYGITQRGAYHVKHGTVCQDAHKIISRTDGIVIAAVADGLGSEEHSDIASKIAVDVSTTYCTEHITSLSTFEEIRNVIEISFQFAQNTIEKKARINEHGIDQYDTTLTLAVVIGNRLYYGHSGDSGIIALTDAGLYEQVTQQQQDEQGRVFPLFREDRWVFDRYDKGVASVLLATDGLFETLIPLCLQDDPVKIHVKIARFFMDNRYLRIDEVGENEVRSRIFKFIDDIPGEQVDDDKTVVVLVNTDVSYVLEPGEYVDLPDVVEREEERKKKVQEELYPNLSRDKKRDDATHVSLPMSAAAPDHETKQPQLDVSLHASEGGKEIGKDLPLLTKAAEQGDVKAQTILAGRYFSDEGGGKDHEKTVYWHTKAAKQGNTDAQNQLASFTSKTSVNDGVKKKRKSVIIVAIMLLISLVACGYILTMYAPVQNSLGTFYHDGLGVGQDYEKAVYWYTRAAEQGHARAQNNLGGSYYNGQGVEKDSEKAVYWYTLAAEQGYAIAQYNLGFGYANGEGVGQDDEKAVYWYTLAAEQGHAGAQYNLGYRYYNGQGVEKDYEKAVYWYTRASEQGNSLAQYQLHTLRSTISGA